jgi:selenocysteine-specific elongation factor
MRVIGTAGHVDHGKSTLVEALTGMNPDRLKEERERQMTIDLGFAWFSLPDGEQVGIVDVPGHRDFIENMLAGIGGIDAALLVIAADEGVMPQTREHLAILDLLKIAGGVVALTKIDLIDDPAWLDMVEEEVRETLTGSVLAEAPLVRVSARTGQGLAELVEALRVCLASRPPRRDLGRPRLPVDRVFSIAGFGTVVTGTLSDGELRLGDEVEILPGGLRGRVRGLQSHKQKEEIARPGSRTAVNISGVTVNQIRRGDVLAHPGDYQPTRRLDVQFHLLPEASQPMKHNIQVKLFLGAAEVLARVRLLGTDSLDPGEDGWLQLELREPVVAVRGDRFIIRRPSPGETLGGGTVIDPHPKGRHRRFSSAVLKKLESFASGSPTDILRQALASAGVVPLKDLVAASGLPASEAERAVADLMASGELVILDAEGDRAPLKGDALVSAERTLKEMIARAVREVEGYHRSHPMRLGMPREELKSRLRMSSRVFNTFLGQLISQGIVNEAGPLVHLPGFEIRFSDQEQKLIQTLMERFRNAPFAPPTVKECQAAVGVDVYEGLVQSGQLIQVSSDVVFRVEDYIRIVAELKALFEERKRLTAAQVRDHFNTSRRYVLALLEHLDETGVTVREGDYRRLR